ncbi:hypothetical protein LCGC14_2962430 [marine sediment metagenome]|uniref:Uncharacterized protein n=1 Tax=marine sediment metagenome TaxID=412755 RepID=A0A0F9A351_9ZZZZ
MTKIMEFFDVKTRKRFKTSNFKVRIAKNGRKQIVADVPKSIRGKDKPRKSFRFVKDNFKR